MDELTDEPDHIFLTYHFKGDTAKKRFDDYDDGRKLFLKSTI